MTLIFYIAVLYCIVLINRDDFSIVSIVCSVNSVYSSSVGKVEEMPSEWHLMIFSCSKVFNPRERNLS